MNDGDDSGVFSPPSRVWKQPNREAAAAALRTYGFLMRAATIASHHVRSLLGVIRMKIYGPESDDLEQEQAASSVDH